MGKFLLYLLFFMSLTGVATANTNDILIDNANGFTFDDQRQLLKFSSMVIKDGKVEAIDQNSLRKLYPNITVIDLKGKTLIPGLTDAHGHVLGLGFSRLLLDVRDITTAKSTAASVKSYAAKHPDFSWIKGRGWNQVLWPDKTFPTAALLDAYERERPVWLQRVDGHAGWANSRALALAGITKDTVAPEGGEIIRDANGNPTGVLVDNAMEIMERVIPAFTMKEMESALTEASQHLLSLGVTSVHDAGIDSPTVELYKKLSAEKRLLFRIYGMLSGSDKLLAKQLAHGYVSDEQDMLSIRSVKLYIDGALGSRGAALLKPYSDNSKTRGLLLTNQEQLRQLYQLIMASQFQINIHAIGDRGVRLALDEFEYAFSKGQKNFRHRIEHAQVVALTDIARFKQLDIIPSMQPSHATSDKNMAQDRVGKERLKGAYAWRKFLSQGSRIAAGSDFPVELSNPFFGLHASVTRQDRDNKPAGGWIKNEAMTVEEALRAFTIDAAYAAHQDSVLGGLTAGKWADFIVINQDIFSIDPKEIWKTRVLQTWVAGKSMYQLE